MKIYVACLASYVSGHLHGEWIDLDSCVDLEDLEKAVSDMLKKSPAQNAEEFAIHDTENAPNCIKEYTPLSEVWEIQEMIEEHDHETVVALLDHYMDIEETQRILEDGLCRRETKEELIYERALSAGISENAYNMGFCDEETVWRTIEHNNTTIFLYTEHIPNSCVSNDWYLVVPYH